MGSVEIPDDSKMSLGSVEGSVEILDNSTIIDFVEDEKAFNEWIRDRFNQLDSNQDDLLSYGEMVKEFEDMRLGLENAPKEQLDQVYGEIFSGFDRNSDGSVDFEEFAAGMKRMILAVADGIGFTPVEMVLEDGGFLKKAVERESLVSKPTT